MLQQPSINVRNSSTSRSLQLRIVVGKILLQPLKEIPLAILLAFQADANERRDCLAHAPIGIHRPVDPCSFGSSLARFSFNLLKKSRLRSSWLSRPMRTSAAIALLMLRSEFIDQSILAASDRRWQDSPSTS